ncbi:MAG: heat-inducible transcription repressor HrcA [Clostridia bacterium]|nr:heat-inducible transcription repressor HrcA [Clostridia bacterium]
MKLSKRKEKILKAVVESNLSSGEPISSKAIQQEYLPDVSSATIRNELMSLEEMGYLTHLHTSSGRVPTTEGYRKYVQELMPTKKLTKKEVSQIQSNFTDKLVSLNDIMVRSAKTISDACNYASVVYFGAKDTATILQIKIMTISDSTKLVVVATDLGVISEMANLGEVSQTELDEAGRIMTEIFAGKPLSSLEDQRYRISKELVKYKQIFETIIDTIAKRDNTKIAVAGKEKIMDYPEFEDVNKLKNAIKLLDNDEKLLPILKNSSSGDGVEISISVGGANDDLSIVTATYKIKGDKTFSTGVVGPVRMDYAKAISVLKEVSDTIKDITDKE